MEIRITTSHILKVLLLLTWIIFIGLCVEAGAIIVNTFITLFINPDAVKNFWEKTRFHKTIQYTFKRFHFKTVVLVIRDWSVYALRIRILRMAYKPRCRHNKLGVFKFNRIRCVVFYGNNSFGNNPDY